MATAPVNIIKLTPGKEYPEKGEEEIAYAIVKLLQQQMLRMYKNTTQQRQIHPKMNGCVKGEFIIEKNLPEDLKVGLFKDEKVYPAWIRFSNGNTRPLDDRKKDIRGFAIKIMNVPGDKFVETKIGGSNLDFILMNTKTFVSRRVKDFYSILKVVTVPYKPGSFFPKLFSVIKNVPIIMRAGKAKIKCNHPFELYYYSTVPFRFGDESRAVKYAIVPSAKNELEYVEKKNKDFLKHNMAATLNRHEIIYDFMIQFQTDAEKMPIEDPSVEWESPFIKMATIRIPVQVFDTKEQNEFGENLSFNTWRTIKEHRPLGSFNRVRKIIYEEMSAFRHQHNHVEEMEPEANEDFLKNLNITHHEQRK